MAIPSFTPESIQKIKGVLGENPPVILKNPLDSAGLGFAAITQAVQMLRQIKGSLLLEGYRGKPPGNVQALTGIITRLSNLVQSTDEIVEMDLNPVVAYPDSALVLDARIVLRPDCRS
ncbi:MAG: acetate--CoA ligase family protein [Desulfurispora sp.]|uniref:acetate--CoA ligase family protein n=1 Tax=Desulfurispora sp. TaxID=3014275 RepID=UPI00404B2CBB